MPFSTLPPPPLAGIVAARRRVALWPLAAGLLSMVGCSGLGGQSVTLDEAELNRLGSTFDLSAADRLFGKAVQGTLGIDCALRFEPADDSIRLTQVAVQQFQFDSGGSALPPQARRIGALLAERMLEDLAIYRLKPEQAERLRAAGLRAGTVAVTSRGVEVTLLPR